MYYSHDKSVLALRFSSGTNSILRTRIHCNAGKMSLHSLRFDIRYITCVSAFCPVSNAHVYHKMEDSLSLTFVSLY